MVYQILRLTVLIFQTFKFKVNGLQSLSIPSIWSSKDLVSDENGAFYSQNLPKTAIFPFLFWAIAVRTDIRGALMMNIYLIYFFLCVSLCSILFISVWFFPAEGPCELLFDSLFRQRRIQISSTQQRHHRNQLQKKLKKN